MIEDRNLGDTGIVWGPVASSVEDSQVQGMRSNLTCTETNKRTERHKTSGSRKVGVEESTSDTGWSL